jgi:hypothetical protein
MSLSHLDTLSAQLKLFFKELNEIIFAEVNPKYLVSTRHYYYWQLSKEILFLMW